jgi:hypothetical protein
MRKFSRTNLFSGGGKTLSGIMSLVVVIASVLSTKVTVLPFCQPPKTWEYGWYETYVQSGHLCSPFQWGE